MICNFYVQTKSHHNPIHKFLNFLLSVKFTVEFETEKTGTIFAGERKQKKKNLLKCVSIIRSNYAQTIHG